jgi:hypothetical protein
MNREHAQVRLHPVRSLGVLALIGVVGWRAVAPRTSGLAGSLRRFRWAISRRTPRTRADE